MSNYTSLQEKMVELEQRTEQCQAIVSELRTDLESLD